MLEATGQLAHIQHQRTRSVDVMAMRWSLLHVNQVSCQNLSSL